MKVEIYLRRKWKNSAWISDKCQICSQWTSRLRKTWYGQSTPCWMKTNTIDNGICSLFFQNGVPTCMGDLYRSRQGGLSTRWKTTSMTYECWLFHVYCAILDCTTGPAVINVEESRKAQLSPQFFIRQRLAFINERFTSKWGSAGTSIYVFLVVKYFWRRLQEVIFIARDK